MWFVENYGFQLFNHRDMLTSNIYLNDKERSVHRFTPFSCVYPLGHDIRITPVVSRPFQNNGHPFMAWLSPRSLTKVANTVFNTWFRVIPLPHEHYGIPNIQHLDWFSSILYRIEKKENIKAWHYESSLWKALLWHNRVFLQHYPTATLLETATWGPTIPEHRIIFFISARYSLEVPTET